VVSSVPFVVALSPEALTVPVDLAVCLVLIGVLL
jgi:hypothetical protein